MSASIKNMGSGGGVPSSELTAMTKDVVSGKTYVGSDTNDDIGIGGSSMIPYGVVGVRRHSAGAIETIYLSNSRLDATTLLVDKDVDISVVDDEFLHINKSKAEIISGSPYYMVQISQKKIGDNTKHNAFKYIEETKVWTMGYFRFTDSL